jgi:hypothetical protein
VIPHVCSTDFLKIADFYNWNRVKVRYCDGSSFTGDVAAVESVCSGLVDFMFVYVLDIEIDLMFAIQSTNLHYRGARVWNAIIEDLLEKGMSKAQNVCSLLIVTNITRVAVN